ncbi:MAG: c-type cytochrome [Nitrospinales bacterium]
MKKTFITLILAIFTLSVTASAFAAGECPQKRKTKSAPSNIAKKRYPKGASMKLGKKIFHDQKFAQSKGAPMACFNCHGNKGAGDGKLGALLTPKPRNFTCKATMKKISAGQMFWIVKNGSKGTGMVAHKKLKDVEIWSVVKYIRGVLMGLAKKKKKS